jgi:hypothetical protein
MKVGKPRLTGCERVIAVLVQVSVNNKPEGVTRRHTSEFPHLTKPNQTSAIPHDHRTTPSRPSSPLPPGQCHGLPLNWVTG